MARLRLAPLDFAGASLLKRFFAPVWVFNLGIFFSLAGDWWPSRMPRRTGTSLPLEALTSIAQRRFRGYKGAAVSGASGLAESADLVSNLGIFNNGTIFKGINKRSGEDSTS